MIDSIFIALSGMQGHERGLNVISNNVSNLNTPGFRGSTVNFANVFSGPGQQGLQNGQRSSQQYTLGGGLDASRTLLDMRTADAQKTGVDLDLALQGDGFFVLQDASGELRYTRAGRFKFNTDEVLVAGADELKVMARNAAGELVPVTLEDLRLNPSKATSEVTLDGFLSTSDGTGDSEHTIESLAVFDAAGGKHTLQLKFNRETTSGTTVWKMKVLEGTTEIGAGDLEFFGSQPTADAASLKVTLALSGVDPVEISFDYSTVAAIGTSSTLAVSKQDGFGQGTISTKTFDEKGVLKLTYSNGQTAEGAQLVLAQIGDDAGLIQLDNALFAYRGGLSPNMREAGEDLKVLKQSLEPSNVDLTQEFSELILMQRGYQASSQVVSTANDMLQDLLDMRGRG